MMNIRAFFGASAAHFLVPPRCSYKLVYYFSGEFFLRKIFSRTPTKSCTSPDTPPPPIHTPPQPVWLCGRLNGLMSVCVCVECVLVHIAPK